MAGVVNIRDRTPPANPADLPPAHVYVGRRVSRGPYRLPASIWANPHKLPPDATPEQREQAVAAYEADLLGRPDLVARLGELAGKGPVCWCAPKLCHGDILARMAAEAGARRAP